MKKLFTLVAFVAAIFSFNDASAQACTPNPSNTTAGFTPTPASPITQGVAYSQCTQLYVPPSVSVSGITATIDSIKLDSIGNLPSGITYVANPASGVVDGGGNGSILFSGTTSDTVGTYALIFYGTAYVTISGFSEPLALNQPPVSTDFSYALSVVAASVTETCDTIVNISFDLDTPSLYGWNPGVGIISGNGGFTYQGTTYTTTDVAEKLTAGVGDTVNETAVFFGFVTINAGDSAQAVKVYVYDNSGTSNGVTTGGPGIALDSGSVTLRQIAVAAAVGNPNVITFSNHAPLTTSSFYIVVKLPTVTGDTVGIVTNTGNTTYGQGYLNVPAAGGWFQYTGLVGGIDSLGNYIVAVVCGTAFPPVAAFTQSATTGCAPLAVTFTDASTGATSYSWNFGDGSAASTATNPSHTYTAAGTYTVTETVTNTTGSATFSSGVTVSASPATTVYVTNATTSTSTDGAAGVVATGGSGSFTYSWNTSNTTDSISGVVQGTYYVTVTSGGCSTTDTVVISFGYGINTLSPNVHIKVYPNPANDQLNFEWNLNDEATITIYDVTGQAIKSYMVNSSVSKLDIHEFAAGLYVLRVVDNANNEQQSLTFTKF